MRVIAVLIATKNEESTILSRLNNIQKCYVPEGFSLNVAILDNGSSDATIEVVQKFSFNSNLQVFVHELPPIGKCGALFWAFENIKADYFLMTDANTVVTDFCHEIISIKSPIVWVGNGLGFPYGSDVSHLDKQFLGALQERHRIESNLNLFSGANGGCYGLSSALVAGISELNPTRNDDFIISVFAASKGKVAYARNSYAYEFYSDKLLDLFKNKFRDSVGHANAIFWIIANVRPLTFAIKVILSRLVFWLSPAALGLVCLYINFYIFLALTIVVFVVRRSLFIKYLALIGGLSFGLFKKAPVAWNPIRQQR